MSTTFSERFLAKKAFVKELNVLYTGTDEGSGVENFHPEEFPYCVLMHTKTGQIICIPAVKMTPEERSIKRLKRKIRQAIKDGIEFKAMWSLTFSDENFHLENFNGQIMRKFLNRIQQYMKRQKSSKITYVWKYEEGKKSNRPHFHLLVNGYVPLKTVRRMWGLGNVELKGITSQKMAVNYVSKYICKGGVTKYWSGNKRYSSSRDIGAIPRSEWRRLGWSKDVLDLTTEFYKSGPLPQYF